MKKIITLLMLFLGISTNNASTYNNKPKNGKTAIRDTGEKMQTEDKTTKYLISITALNISSASVLSIWVIFELSLIFLVVGLLLFLAALFVVFLLIRHLKKKQKSRKRN